MENNLENKAKFFAQYWGLDIIRVNDPEWRIRGDNTRIVDAITLESDSFKKFSLELKHLSSITEEDALHIAKSMYTAIPDYQTISNGKCMVSCHENQIGLGLLQSDYLRSKGYALPWMELSVEKQIEYGWVKLKEK